MKPNESQNDLRQIAVTMGDPAGVGPELCCQLLERHVEIDGCLPVVFGSQAVLADVAKRCGRVAPESVIPFLADDPQTSFKAIRQAKVPTVLDIPGFDPATFEPGVVSKMTGELSHAYIQTAIDAALAGAVDGVATGPINKLAWRSAGIQYPGHTELFAERFETDRFCMMMTAPSFSCSLVTTHVGYAEVATMLTVEGILEVIELTYGALQKIVGREPKLVVLGLNPHAGEGGLFGNQEEERLIQPAMQQAIARGIELEGPLPPDTAFLPWRREATDGYICMYHDQGLIPFKALNFDTGVNITLGLPMVRTSVDHGTALDIAWQGKADVSSFIAAVELAGRLAERA